MRLRADELMCYNVLVTELAKANLRTDPSPTYAYASAGRPAPFLADPSPGPLPYPDGNASEQIERSEIPSPVFSGEGVTFFTEGIVLQIKKSPSPKRL